MRKSRRILFAALVAAVLGALAWVTFRAPVEPSYQGKSLSQWLEVYQPSTPSPGLIPTNFAETENARAAILHMDTNALPFLMRKLQSRDSAAKLWLISVLKKQHLIKINHVPARNRQSQATEALRVLGPRAASAVPELIRMYDGERGFEERAQVAMVLYSIGPAAKAAVPSLLRDTTNSIEWIRHWSVVALGGIHSEPETVVPALIKSLQDPQALVRLNAVHSLGAFGPDARSAVPALRELSERPNTNFMDLQSAAKNALRRIDPDSQ